MGICDKPIAIFLENRTAGGAGRDSAAAARTRGGTSYLAKSVPVGEETGVTAVHDLDGDQYTDLLVPDHSIAKALQPRLAKVTATNRLFSED